MKSAPVLEVVHPPGEPWTHVLRAGERLRITDLEGTQAVDTIFYNAADPCERYSAADTVRAQGNIFLTTGSVLLSNDGNPMLTIVEDSCGRHDTLGGACSAESNTCRFGHETRYMHNCRDNFLVGLARHGLGKRDLVPNINFAPSNWPLLNTNDADLGSIGPTLLPRGLEFQVGKQQTGYLLDTSALGHVGGGTKTVTVPNVCAGQAFGGLAYGGGQVFVPCDEGIQALAVDTVGRTVTKTWKTSLGHPGAPIYTSGVVWSVDTDTGILTALRGTDGAVLATINVGSVAHFASPAAADGLLLIGTSTKVRAYR